MQILRCSFVLSNKVWVLIRQEVILSGTSIKVLKFIKVWCIFILKKNNKIKLKNEFENNMISKLFQLDKHW